MTSKERMMRALNREKPDRLPVSLHQWQKYHLDKYLGGMSDLDAFEKFGFDTQAQYFGDVGQTQVQDAAEKSSTESWRIEAEVISDNPDNLSVNYTINTPEGVLTHKIAGDQKTIWVTEYMVKRDEDIRLIGKYMPVPKLNLNTVSNLYDQLGDRGVLRGFVWGGQAGCWQHACCLMDVNELLLACIDKPDWVHEFLGYLLKKKLQFIESMKGAKF
jgi:uroporphyrinogen decarboxylase